MAIPMKRRFRIAELFPGIGVVGVKEGAVDGVLGVVLLEGGVVGALGGSVDALLGVGVVGVFGTRVGLWLVGVRVGCDGGGLRFARTRIRPLETQTFFCVCVGGKTIIILAKRVCRKSILVFSHSTCKPFVRLLIDFDLKRNTRQKS